MTIDEQIDGLRKAAVICTSVFAYDCQGYIKEAIDTLCKYQQLQADYEARLKADMVATLTDLKNKLIDKSWNIDMYDDNLDFECCYLNDIDEVIQQKIDALEEIVRGTESEVDHEQTTGD